jgi:hypothetical protein
MKIIPILIMCLFAMSMFALAQGGEAGNDAGLGSDDRGVENSSTTDDSAGVSPQELEQEAAGEPNPEGCVQKLLSKFPNADRVMVINACRGMTDPARMRGELRDRERIQERVDAAISNRDRVMQQMQERVADWRAARLNHSMDEGEGFLSNMSEEKLKVFSHLPRAEQERIMKDKLADALDRYRLRTINSSDLYRNRNLTQERLAHWEEQFQKAKERFDDAQQKQQERRDSWLQKKQEWEQKCNDTNSTECAQLQAETIERAKEYLNNSVTMAIQHLEQVKSRAEESDSLSEDQLTEMSDYIDERLSNLQAIQDDIPDAETKGDVKALAQRLEAEWRIVRYKAVAFAAHIMNTRVDIIIRKSEKIEERLNCALQQMEDAGNDTSALDAKVDEFSAKVQSAKDEWRQARDLYAEIRNMSDDDRNATKEKSEELKAHVTSAHDDLLEAHGILNEIHKEIRASGIDISACSVEDKDLSADEAAIVEETG